MVPHLSIIESSLGNIMEEMRFCVHKISLKRSPKVKSAMALYLKTHFMRCTNYVQSFMLLSKSAQFLEYAALLRIYRIGGNFREMEFSRILRVK